MVNLEQVIDILSKSSIGGIDIFAIFLLIRESRFFLTNIPDVKDYQHVPQKARKDRIDEDCNRLRKLGIFCFVLIPPISIFSLLVVAYVITHTQ